MRRLSTALVFGGLGLLGAWQVLAVVAAPRVVESSIRQLAADETLVEARDFAMAGSRLVSARGLSGRWIVTMSSSVRVTPGEETLRRSVAVHFDGAVDVLFGLSQRPVTVSLAMSADLQRPVPHDASHWPEHAEPLDLGPLLPGQRGPRQFMLKESSWATPSHSGAVVLHSTEVSKGCEVRCEKKDGSVLWSETAPCQMPKEHLRFVSEDCERIVTIDPAPINANLWQTLPIARVFTRSKLEYEVAAVTLVSDGALMKRSRGWLRGHSEVSGDGPTYRDDGEAVVLVTVEGKRHELPLVKAQLPRAGAPTK
ncbi:MAG: hypothetical protein JNJ54_11785 [Myxococcaceae bacterium]|nr:hypothetical protein [Myxococcaceae bacterium]